MKKILLLTLIVLTNSLVSGQQKKSKRKTFPPPIKREAPVVMAEPIAEIVPLQPKNCFVFNFEEKKDSLLYVSKSLLEYGWAGDNARMVITSYNYDPVKKKEVEKDGKMLLFHEEKMQFINGSYKFEQDLLIFTPEKTDRFEKRTFRLIYKTKTKKVDYLQDEKNNKYVSGGCQEAMVSR